MALSPKSMIAKKLKRETARAKKRALVTAATKAYKLDERRQAKFAKNNQPLIRSKMVKTIQEIEAARAAKEKENQDGK